MRVKLCDGNPREIEFDLILNHWYFQEAQNPKNYECAAVQVWFNDHDVPCFSSYSKNCSSKALTSLASIPVNEWSSNETITHLKKN